MTSQAVPTIDPQRPLWTLINVYEVAPERQAELAQALAEATDAVMRRQPGFVSVSIHCSLDGARVANYAQWESREDFERMMKSPEAQEQIRRFAAVATSVSPAVYRVASVHA